LYLYPVTQRNYIISKKANEGDVGEVDFIAAPSADRIETQYEVAVYFKLNLDNIKEFHENIGLKYHAWTDEGWLDMLHTSFRQQIEFALQREARKYNVADIYADRATLETIQSEVGTALKENVAEILGDDYFCGPTYQPGASCPDFEFVIKRVTIPDKVKESFESNRTSEIEIVTRENEVRQAELQAQAIDTLNEALSSAQSADAYVLLKAIEAGTIDFWVIPDGGTTLTLPQRQP
jgi:regulator of protease activity HflC (stomatin/prohibitin superfamily)